MTYSAEEIALLRTMWPRGERADILAAFPTRQWAGLHNKAHRLRLVRLRTDAYTEEEDELIRQRYPTEGGVVLSKLLNRPSSSLYQRILKLGVRYIDPPKEEAIARARLKQAAKQAAAREAKQQAAKLLPPKPAPIKVMSSEHNPIPKAKNTLKSLRVIGSVSKTSPNTPNLNASKAIRQRGEKAGKGESVTEMVKKLPADSEGRRVYLLAGRNGGQAAQQAFLAWHAQQAA